MSSIKDQAAIDRKMVEYQKMRHAKETQQLERSHQARLQELKRAQNAEIVEIHDQHLSHINDEGLKKDQVLTQMKDHLEATARHTDKELRNLTEHAEKRKVAIHNQLATQETIQKEESQARIEDLSMNYNQKLRDLSQEMDGKTEDVKIKKYAEMDMTDQEMNAKIDRQREDFDHKFKTDYEKFSHLKRTQENNNKTQRIQTVQKHNEEIGKMAKTQEQDYVNRNTQFEKSLNDQNLAFEKKFKDTLDVQTKSYKDLEELNKKQINQLKESYQKEIKIREQRAHDNFYDFNEMKPLLSETPDGYELRVAVPEHSKNDLVLTMNPKELILTFARRYKDNRTDTMGTKTEISKVESYVNRIPVQHVLNAKSVKQTYDGGVLTFIIKRA